MIIINIWLKELSLDDDKVYFDLLMELSNYKDVYARPVPSDFTYSEFDYFKMARLRMKNNDNLPTNVLPTSTYWVMDGDIPIGYATIKHKLDINKPGGHFGLCLKKEYQNKGIGLIINDLLINIVRDWGLNEIIYTAHKDNLQSQKSIQKIGAEFIEEKNGYLYYKLPIEVIRKR